MISPAGDRRHRITVEAHNGNRSGGEATYKVDSDWTPILKDCPAAYQAVGGGEVVRGLQMEANTDALFRILSTERSRQITPKMRVKMRGRTLNVVSVLDKEGDERELFVQVTEDALA